MNPAPHGKEDEKGDRLQKSIKRECVFMLVKLLLFFFIFGVVVLSHEFGHFLLARANRIHVVEFAIGMGPTLLSFQKKDTKYSLKLFPIGGACMFEGEDGLNMQEGEVGEGSFLHANVWSRISTVFAGPLFNLILDGLCAGAADYYP